MTREPMVGDWVRTSLPGVWRVYRVLRGFDEFRYSLDAGPRRSRRVLVFAKRVVGGTWRRAFAARVFEQVLVTPLPPDDLARAEALLAGDPGLRTAFNAYAPPPIDLIVNLSMCVPNAARLTELCEREVRPALADGVPLDHVLQLLRQAGLDAFVGRTPINATLQLACRDHEVRDGHFVLRDCRVLA